MKTNHQRGFKDKRGPKAVFSPYASAFTQVTDDGRVISAFSVKGDACNGKRGHRRDRKGAKKFVNSRTRFHNNAALKKEIAERGNEI